MHAARWIYNVGEVFESSFARVLAEYKKAMVGPAELCFSHSSGGPQHFVPALCRDTCARYIFAQR